MINGVDKILKVKDWLSFKNVSKAYANYLKTVKNSGYNHKIIPYDNFCELCADSPSIISDWININKPYKQTT